jgi:hypothetical protein
VLCCVVLCCVVLCCAVLCCAVLCCVVLCCVVLSLSLSLSFSCPGCLSAYDYCFQKPNPILQVFYLAVVLGCYTCFLFFVLPSVSRSPTYISSHHVSFCYFIMATTLLSFFAVSAVGPGYLTVLSLSLFLSLSPSLSPSSSP